ncbi:MAG: hypothetical protein KF817_12705 [Phycisphaeraceae bacterium]|nr:hypothetical protein [Phycisphaeraceae bacterium]
MHSSTEHFAGDVADTDSTRTRTALPSSSRRQDGHPHARRRAIAGRSVLPAAAMLGVALMAPTTGARAEAVVITQSGFTFTPQQATVAPGQTVFWIHSDGVHTVTSGSGCAQSGLFNAPLSAANPSVEFIVPLDATGEIPYFCMPHCGFGMTGTLIVVPRTPPCPGDLDDSGDVGFNDLLTMLSSWGPCAGCPADLDGSDAVDFADVLALLSIWGPCRR